MQQVILTGPGKLAYRSVAQAPEVPAGHALVAMARIGVCGSDYHAFAGRHPAYVYPRVLGHELAGTIVQVDDSAAGLRAGDRCAIEPYVNCGVCAMCRAGRTNCCVHLEVLGVHRDGGMQELLSVPVRLLHRSETLTMDQLALVETLGIGAHAVERAQVQPGQTVLVVGAGPIGLGVAAFATLAGAEVIVVETHETRRQFAEKQGWKAVAPDPMMQASAVFDATGSAAVMGESLRQVAPGGSLIFVGLTSEPVRVDDALFHRREMTLLASRNSVGQFPRILRLLEARQIVVDDWISEHIELSKLPEVFSGLMHRPEVIKAMVDVPAGDGGELQ